MVAKARKQKTETFTLTCVGMGYRMSKSEISQLAQFVDDEFGLICNLVPEPENEVDPMAIKVVGLDPKRARYRGAHIGYVQRPANEALFNLLARGATVDQCVLETVDIDSASGVLQVELRRPHKKPAK